jgi:hypothetical protein
MRLRLRRPLLITSWEIQGRPLTVPISAVSRTPKITEVRELSRSRKLFRFWMIVSAPAARTE